MTDWLDSLSFAQKQRLQFIEAMLIWDGSVQRGDVCKVFHVTPNHLTRDIKRYRTSHKGALEYDVESRAYRKGLEFRPLLASGSPEEYLTLLQAYSASHSTAVLPAMGHIVASESLAQPTGSIDADVLKHIILAVREGTGVALTYQSFTDPAPTPRTLWPHTLVFNGERWHIRAFDGRREQFKDFVLSRCSDPRAEPKPSPSPMSNDHGWHELIAVDVVPQPHSSETQKKVIAREFGMTPDADGNYVWSANIRKCFVGYFLIRYRLERADLAGTPEGVGQHPYIFLKHPELATRFRFKND